MKDSVLFPIWEVFLGRRWGPFRLQAGFGKYYDEEDLAYGKEMFDTETIPDASVQFYLDKLGRRVSFAVNMWNDPGSMIERLELISDEADPNDLDAIRRTLPLLSSEIEDAIAKGASEV